MNESFTITPTVLPANASNKNVTWSSSSPAATVSGGVVTGQSAGSAIITCTTVDGGKKASCIVTVTDYNEGYGDFMKGMRIIKNASNPLVMPLVRLLLTELGYFSWMDFDGFVIGGVQHKYDDEVYVRINFKNENGLDNSGDNTGVIDLGVWISLWNKVLLKDPASRSSYFNQAWAEAGEQIPICPTIERAFMLDGDKGGDTVKLHAEGNRIFIKYYPKFYFEDDLDLTEQEKTDIINYSVNGCKKWEGVYNNIYGVNVEVQVSVTPSTVVNKDDANVKFIKPDGKASMVYDAIWWKFYKNLAIDFRYDPPVTSPATKPTTAQLKSYIEWTIAHEFGHVLGLFDAYGYEGHFPNGDFFINPEADISRAAADDIMRSMTRVTDTNIKMLLWAWCHNKLQLYSSPALIHEGLNYWGITDVEESQAFFHI